MAVSREEVGSELTAGQLYALLRLRVNVFLIEQRIAYRDLDGLDLRGSTRHFWLEDDGDVLSYVRVVAGSDEVRIGRVCTARACRRLGFARTLLSTAVERYVDGPLVLDAQSYIVDFYRQFGFVVDGPSFLDDGVQHWPMRRNAGSQAV